MTKLAPPGAIHIDDVGGDVEMKPGGDLVGGDKTTMLTDHHRYEGVCRRGTKARVSNAGGAVARCPARSQNPNGSQCWPQSGLKGGDRGEVVQQVKALKDVKKQVASARHLFGLP